MLRKAKKPRTHRGICHCRPRQIKENRLGTHYARTVTFPPRHLPAHQPTKEKFFTTWSPARESRPTRASSPTHPSAAAQRHGPTQCGLGAAAAATAAETRRDPSPASAPCGPRPRPARSSGAPCRRWDPRRHRRGPAAAGPRPPACSAVRGRTTTVLRRPWCRSSCYLAVGAGRRPRRRTWVGWRAGAGAGCCLGDCADRGRTRRCVRFRRRRGLGSRARSRGIAR